MNGWLIYISSNIIQAFKKSTKYYNQLLEAENFSTLYHTFHKNSESVLEVGKEINLNQMLDASVYSIYSRFGFPTYSCKQVKNGVKYEILVYKRILNGMKTKIVYHVLNSKVATVSYRIKKSNEEQLQTLKNALAAHYNLELDQLPESFSLRDGQNRYLTFDTVYDIHIDVKLKNNRVYELLKTANRIPRQEKQTTEKSVEWSF